MRLFETALLGLGAWAAYRYLTAPVYRYQGRHVLITGGSRGLGLLMARELVSHDAKLTICARDQAELDRARDDLTARGGEVLTVECDVTSQDDVAHLVRQATGRFGPVDVLINNAGIIGVGPAEEMRLEDFELAMQTHFWAALYTTMEVLPEMRRRGQGRIVNISSIGGKIAVPHLLPYTASKFALTGFSEGLRAEVAKDGIAVTTVCPGLMRTGSHIQAEFKGQNDLEYAWFAISNAMPLFSVSGESAAHSILRACARGDAELIITIPARLAVLLNAIAPELLQNVNAVVNRLLPGPGGIGTQRAKGYDSRESTPSALTALADWASRENNEAAGASAAM